MGNAKKKCFRLVALALSVVIVLTCFSACNDGKNDDEVSISFLQSSVSMTIGDVLKLNVEMNPSDLVLTWQSSNNLVATVTQNGIVNALTQGSAVISVFGGGKRAECNVSVSPKGLDSEKEDDNEGWSYDLSAPHIIINQIMGIGNKSNDDQSVSHSFVELYNPTPNDVDLSGYSLQSGTVETGSASGSAWNVLALDGVIESKSSFLIVLSKYTNTSTADSGKVAPNLVLTEWDMQWDNVHFPNKNLKVVLLKTTTPLNVVNPFDIDNKGTKAEFYCDMIGFTSNDYPAKEGEKPIDAFEGSNFIGQSKQKSARRKLFIDTDNGANDLEVIDFRLGKDDVEINRPRSKKDGKWEQFRIDFSHESGGYESDIELEISVSGVKGASEIRYTTDGSEPTALSPLYSQPILLTDKTDNWRNLPITQNSDAYSQYNDPSHRPSREAQIFCGNIIKVRCFLDSQPLTDVITRSYFISETIFSRYDKNPIISISGQFDDFNNMFLNPYSDEKRFFNYEYFDFDGEKYFTVFNALGYTKTSGGGYTTGFGQKSLYVNLSKNPYSANIRYPIFDDVPNFKRFRLWSGGNNFIRESWASTGDLMRDLFIQNTAKGANGEGLKNVATTKGRLVVVFVNGEYYGMMSIREHYDEDYAETHFKTERGNLAQIKVGYYGNVNNRPGINIGVTDGDIGTVSALYNDFSSFMAQTDFKNPSNYEKLINEYIDIESFIDYYILNVFYDNWDWMFNNVRMWRAITPQNGSALNDGKWRFLVQDVDLSCLINRPPDEMYQKIARGVDFYSNISGLNYLFFKLFANDSFMNDFCQRTEYLLANHFTAEYVMAEYTALIQERTPLLSEHYQRFTIARNTDSEPSYFDYNKSVNVFYTATDETIQFLTDRQNKLLQHFLNPVKENNWSKPIYG